MVFFGGTTDRCCCLQVGVMLKQFLPQLQTTFLKALTDANRAVRIKAGLAMAQLVVIHTRADPLFSEMHAHIKNAEDPAVRETMLQALRAVISAGADKMSDATPLALLATLTSTPFLAHAEDPPRGAVGGCLGALLHCLPAPHRDAALLHHVLAASDDWLLQHGRSCALFVALKETPEHVYRDPFEEKIEKALLGYLQSDKIPVACNGIRGIAYLARHLLFNGRAVPSAILSQFVRVSQWSRGQWRRPSPAASLIVPLQSMNHSSNEVKQLVARAGALLAREGALDVRAAPAAEALKALLPALVNGTKEKNTYVRANSELALRAILRLPQEDDFCQVRIRRSSTPILLNRSTDVSDKRLQCHCTGALALGRNGTRILTRTPTGAESADSALKVLCISRPDAAP